MDMRLRITLLFVILGLVAAMGERSEAAIRRFQRNSCCPQVVCCPTVTTMTPQAAPAVARVRTYSESDTPDEEHDIDGDRLTEVAATDGVAINAPIPTHDLFLGSDRKIPKTTIARGGSNETFADVDALIAFFESPLRKQERLWRTVIMPTTKERNAEVELVNVKVRDAWIYEISRQGDNDFLLMLGVHPDRDQGKYVIAEVSAINVQSPDVLELWMLRKSFRTQYEDHTNKPLPMGHTQPRKPLHVRISGSIFLDTDHPRGTVGHGDIKNFTSWEIHPITSITILGE
jgi:hypothetical protein